jgi:dihydroorotate dehydrogenase (fumarate)/dihydroorotate dehydrogenase
MNVFTSIFRPALFRLESERAHELAKTALRRRWLWTPLASRFQVRDDRLKVDFGGVELANPVGLSAGFDKNSEMLDAFQAFGFGYAVVGSIRGVPAEDNPAPRLLRYPEREALINCTGFPSKGAAYSARHLKAFRRRQRSLTVVGNVTGFSIDEAVTALEAVQPHVDVIEISLSCPNEAEDHLEQNFLHPPTFTRLIETFNARKRKPFFVKIRSPHNERELENRLELVELCVKLGLDGVQLPGSQVRPEPKLSLGRGAMGGRPVRPYTMEYLHDVYAITGNRLAVKALGGIFTAEDAWEAIAAGASSVELLTAFVYRGPAVAREINTGLLRLLDERGVTSIRALRGTAARPAEVTRQVMTEDLLVKTA